MRIKHSHRRTLLCSAAFGALSITGTAWAQEDTSTDEDTVIELIEEEEEVSRQEKVVVTGSRIARDEFQSTSPIQVITADESADIGLIDAASILQDATVSGGQQIDASFAGFVLDNGPGAATANLRGLGADRTLVLVNGRRLAPAGVEGAPASPDISLIPAGLVDRYDILLDGASSVYGSDAVAGVINAVLKTDFDGFEVEAFRTQPQQGGGEETRLGITWGASTDRGYFGFGAEYFDRTTIKLADRDFSALCDRHFEITESGRILNEDLQLEQGSTPRPGFGTSPCKASSLVGRIIPDGNRFGSIYYTPGFSNTGIPNFSENDQFGAIYDGNGDGLTDISWFDYSLNGTPADRAADLLGGTTQYSFLTYGEVNLDALGGTTPYYEASFTRREGISNGGPPQLFPDVPANNPFNPCNPAGVNGVDCQAAYEASLLDPNYVSNFINIYGVPPTFFGFLFPGTRGPIGVLPVVSVQGDRDDVTFDVSQTRLVGGFKGDLPGINFGPVKNWSYDISGSFSRSEGNSNRDGIRDDRLQLSLNTTIEDPNNPGSFVCGLDVDGDGIPDPNSTPGGCVPVNLFAPSLYTIGGGDFATQEERDFLFGNRTFNTVYEQSVINAAFVGDVFELPGGTAGAAVGFEYRMDEIESNPSDVARDGLFFGFFSDGGAVGSKDLYEAFFELSLPLVADAPWATELDADLSARWTEDQYYGSAWTYSAKVGYRPVNYLKFKATAGTSFRAPNLRELFLQGQTGFLTLSDPCVVPEAAIVLNTTTGEFEYDPTQDTRPNQVFANCAVDGIDATSFDPNGNNNSFFSTEISRGGSLLLDEETSESFTVGFSLEQPWFDAFDLEIGIDYWDIQVDNAVAEPGSQTIVNACYLGQSGQNNIFCARIDRDQDSILDIIDGGFLNIDTETARGIDYKLRYNQEFVVGDRELEAGFSMDVSQRLERATLTAETDSQGIRNIASDEDTGEFYFPDYNGRATATLDYEDWGISWSTRYISQADPDPDAREDNPLGNIFDGTSSTCLGPDAGGENCRNVDFADNYFRHDVALRYSGDTFTARMGVRNVFDETPPLVDSAEVLTNGGNVPIGAGYDVFGRTLFVSVSKEF